MVPSPPAGRRSLRERLLEAGVALARQGGPDALVLREAARRVGVSHNAAYRHFANREDLLRAVADQARAELADTMRERLAEVDPADRSLEAAKRRLHLAGIAYIQFATAQPGLFRTAFTGPGLTAKDAHHPPSTGAAASQLGPFELLQRQVEQLVQVARLPPRARRYASLVAWSAMHGLSMLALDGQLDRLSDQQRDEVVQRLVRMVDAGLLGS
ncbi:MAG TPA: TetR/AcrR family transcriptional regulator [Solirubrobacteraceae bacterium]|nr:TetR/AcrR family transcriptional regulator [Solirubrobacteraceae bacterium]